MALSAGPEAAAPMLPARWFDGLSSKPRPVMVVLQAGAKGPSLLLHPLNEPGAAPVFTHAQVGWPEAWSDRRPSAVWWWTCASAVAWRWTPWPRGTAPGRLRAPGPAWPSACKRA